MKNNEKFEAFISDLKDVLVKHECMLEGYNIWPTIEVWKAQSIEDINNSLELIENQLTD